MTRTFDLRLPLAFIATFEPPRRMADLPTACRNLLLPSQALSMHEAMSSFGCPKVLMSVFEGETWIQLVCDKYSTLTGLSSAHFVGQPASALTESPHAGALVVRAAHGWAQRAELLLCAAGLPSGLRCAVACFPVVARAGGQISHVLLLVETPHNNAPYARPDNMQDARAIQRCANHAGLRSTDADHPRSNPTIRPMEPLRPANVGISSFYTAAGDYGGPDASTGYGGGGSVSIAYARRLYRKYSRASARAAVAITTNSSSPEPTRGKRPRPAAGDGGPLHRDPAAQHPLAASPAEPAAALVLEPEDFLSLDAEPGGPHYRGPAERQPWAVAAVGAAAAENPEPEGFLTPDAGYGPWATALDSDVLWGRGGPDDPDWSQLSPARDGGEGGGAWRCVRDTVA